MAPELVCLAGTASFVPSLRLGFPLDLPGSWGRVFGQGVWVFPGRS